MHKKIEKIRNQLVSIIVPVYRSEKYLTRCLKSLIGQTYKNIEIIIVYNPQSSDSCPRICEYFSKKNRQVRLIEQDDLGPSRARNKALEIAIGNYISFVDSDDFVELTYIENLIKGFEIYNDVKISMCRHTRYFGGDSDNKDDILSTAIERINDEEAFSYILEDQELCAPWGKLYKATVFKNNRFKITRNEDMFIIPELLKESEFVAFSKSKLYYYSQEGESLVRSKYTQESMMAYYDANKYWFETVKKNYPALIPKATNLFNANLIDICRQMSGDKREAIKAIYYMSRTALLKSVSNISCFKMMSFKEKIKFILILTRIK